jgi:hypothetical protein
MNVQQNWYMWTTFRDSAYRSGILQGELPTGAFSLFLYVFNLTFPPSLTILCYLIERNVSFTRPV